jgi:hypothetical protein
MHINSRGAKKNTIWYKKLLCTKWVKAKLGWTQQLNCTTWTVR